MAEEKVDPNRPKDDPNRVATTSAPTATPPVADKPLGTATLEAQREGFKKAEAAAAQPAQENPLEVTGVEGDVQQAQVNPAGSQQPNAEAATKQGEQTKQQVSEQGEQVKTQQQQPPVQQAQPGQTSTEAPTSARSTNPNVPTGSRQPSSAPTVAPAPSQDPVADAKKESEVVQKADPAVQHAEVAQKEGATSPVPPQTQPQPQPKKRGRPKKNP
jgi:hypothetical protein